MDKIKIFKKYCFRNLYFITPIGQLACCFFNNHIFNIHKKGIIIIVVMDGPLL